ncbi:MAG: phosphoglycerate dehydrogenase [Nitrospinae bacterium]|nr:phosphoglycerate dehydrogenase [Nitrospinota bacterium]
MSDKPVVWVGTPFILNFDDPMEMFQPLVEEGLEVWLDECRGYMPEEDVIAALPGVTAVIAGAEPYTAKVMDNAPGVKIIVRAGVGLNNVDISAATERGILVANSAGQNSQSVAEHLFGMLLCAVRRIGWLDANIRKGLWREIQPPMRPLNGMTMGILGFGNIGKQVAKRAVAFDMEVIAHDIVRDEETANALGVRFVSLEELARESDYLTCHVPLTPETTHIINREILSLMKPDAYVFNTSRGPVFDLDAVAEALQNGVIRGAGIDVFPEEPPDYEHPVFALENAVLAPHLGGRGEDAIRNTLRHTTECVLAYFRGDRPSTLVNPEVYEVLARER